MYQFFVDPCQIAGTKVTITGSDVNHIKNVLRMRIGEKLSVVTEGGNKEYQCEIAAFDTQQIICTVESVKEETVELPNQIYLFQGLPKSDKMELVIQKAVELGVFQIIPVQTKRTVVKLDAKKETAKLMRWNAIAEAAAKQAKRRLIPEVKSVMGLKEAMEYCVNFPVKLIPYELSDKEGMQKTRTRISEIGPGQQIAVFIGPEGGFDEREIELATNKGIVPITLGRRILRTETAGLTILAWLVFALEQ